MIRRLYHRKFHQVNRDFFVDFKQFFSGCVSIGHFIGAGERFGPFLLPIGFESLEIGRPGCHKGRIVNSLISATPDRGILEIRFEYGVLGWAEIKS